LKKIPSDVIKNAKGLAIFTTMRTGLWISGAGGSGVLVAKLPDGSWSPPSGIMLHTAGVGFLVGVDIYDCVVVLNTDEALAAFSKVRCTLGAEIAVTTGPVGMGGVLDSELHKRRAPIFTYLKSRGFYAGVQLDGSIVIERTDENERFYSRRLSVGEIMSGKVLYPPPETLRLLHTIKAAQGDSDYDPQLVPGDAPPGDFEIEDAQPFGIPDRDDPDPYGVVALENEGVQIKEAGTQKVASRDSFQFAPSPTSPIFNMFSRESVDGGISRRSSWRTSITERSTHTADMSTQTDFDSPPLPSRPHSAMYRSSMANIPEDAMASIDDQISKGTSTPQWARDPPAESTEQKEAETKDLPMPPTSEVAEAGSEPPIPLTLGLGQTPELKAPEPHSPEHTHDEDADDEDENSDCDDEAVIQEVQQVKKPQIVTALPQVVSKARLVTVAKSTPPALPPRNPGRVRASVSRSPARNPVDVEEAPKLEKIETSGTHGGALEAQWAELPVTASTSSSVYSLPIHDEPSSTQTSESAASVSSVEHAKADESHAAPSSPTTVKPNPPALPPRDPLELQTK
jgi:lipid-binding SYLF domain-containing protein